MREKGKTLDRKVLLAKNPKAAKVLEENRKKMGQNRRLRPRKEYGLGLPYDQSALVSVDERERETGAN